MRENLKKEIWLSPSMQMIKAWVREAYQIEHRQAGADKNQYHKRDCFYAMQSLLQLFNQDSKIQNGSIRDFPKFSERGFMLDLGRKYFEIEYIENMIRKLAWMKMNFIHLHFHRLEWISG